MLRTDEFHNQSDTQTSLMYVKQESLVVLSTFQDKLTYGIAFASKPVQPIKRRLTNPGQLKWTTLHRDLVTDVHCKHSTCAHLTTQINALTVKVTICRPQRNTLPPIPVILLLGSYPSCECRYLPAFPEDHVRPHVH